MIKSAYIHIPFCASICAYCDFCKLLYHEEWVHKYLHALACEIKSNYRGEKIKTLYIGGGTPSSLSISELESLLEICKCFNLDNDYEYTVEANIENIDEAKAKLLKSYGVNRISIGVQSFNDAMLKKIKRNHSKVEVINKITMLKKYFSNINVDLMYALPGEDMDILKEDIADILFLDIPHISTYSLILEPNTEFYIKKVKPISEDLDFEMYTYIEDTLLKRGYKHYETSNYSLEGYESKHNLTYWDNKEYYGFGLGACGYIANVRYENTRSLNHYLKGKYLLNKEVLNSLEDMQNYMILGLRKTKGVSMEEFKDRYHKEIEDVFDIKDLLRDGKLEINDGYLAISHDYIYLANEILINFI